MVCCTTYHGTFASKIQFWLSGVQNAIMMSYHGRSTGSSIPLLEPGLGGPHQIRAWCVFEKLPAREHLRSPADVVLYHVDDRCNDVLILVLEIFHED